MSMKEVEYIHYSDYKDFVEKRKDFVGGSDIGAIMGLNPWCSWYDKYIEKTEGSSFSGNKQTERGQQLEGFVVDMLKKSGHDFETPKSYMMRSKERPFYCANCDGVDFMNGIVYEIKCPKVTTLWDWKKNGIPEYYYAQCQFYMDVLGFNLTKFVVLDYDSWDLWIIDIEYNEDFCIRMHHEVAYFYDCWQKGECPRGYKPQVVRFTPPGKKFYHTIDDIKKSFIATNLLSMLDCKEKIEMAQYRYDELKQEMFDYCEEQQIDGIELEYGRFTVSKQSRGKKEYFVGKLTKKGEE